MAEHRSAPLRPLRPADLERVVEIDRALAGRSRRGFFEKRLQAALAFPDAFVVLGIVDGGRLNGFVFARVQSGEFGEDAPAATLDAIGVDADHQHRGLGRRLLAELERALKKRGVVELRTQIGWNQQALARFFATSDFALAPYPVLERALGRDLEL